MSGAEVLHSLSEMRQGSIDLLYRYLPLSRMLTVVLVQQNRGEVLQIRMRIGDVRRRGAQH
jgi:hypothetical protein